MWKMCDLYCVSVVSVQTEVFINFQKFSVYESKEKPSIIDHNVPPPTWFWELNCHEFIQSLKESCLCPVGTNQGTVAKHLYLWFCSSHKNCIKTPRVGCEEIFLSPHRTILIYIQSISSCCPFSNGTGAKLPAVLWLCFGLRPEVREG